MIVNGDSVAIAGTGARLAQQAWFDSPDKGVRYMAPVPLCGAGVIAVNFRPDVYD